MANVVTSAGDDGRPAGHGDLDWVGIGCKSWRNAVSSDSCDLWVKQEERPLKAVCFKWTAEILDQLFSTPKRTMELKRSISGISMKILTARLRRLEMLGLVTRSRSNDYPLSVHYSLTAHGQSMRLFYGTLQSTGLSFERLANLFKRAWTIDIIRDLLLCPQRPSALLRCHPGISKKVLHQRLHDLEQCGLVRRHVTGGPPIAVEYRLDIRSQSLRVFIETLISLSVASHGKTAGYEENWA